MLVNFEQDERGRHHFDGKSALFASLLAGVLFLVFAKANPWGSLGVPTHVMGRQIFANQAPSDFIMTGVLQMIVSLIYGFVITSIVFRLRTVPSILAGAAIGLALAMVNQLVFRFVFPDAPPSSAAVVFFTHLAFGLIIAGAYKGFSIPRPRPEATP